MEGGGISKWPLILPILRAFAGLLWPQVEAVLRSGVVLDLLREITAEFHAGLAGD